MTQIDPTLQLDDDLLTEVSRAPRPAKSRLVIWALAVLIAVVAAAVIIPNIVITQRRADLELATSDRLTLSAAGRADVLKTWLAGQMAPTTRVAESELFRLFATEIEAGGGDLTSVTVPSDLPLEEGEDPITVPLIEQLPLIERVLTDFAVGAGFEHTYLIGLSGQPYGATAASPPVTDAQKAVAAAAVAGRRIVYGPLRTRSSGLAVDAALPIISAQADPVTGPPVAALLVVLSVGPGIADALRPSPLMEAAEGLALLAATSGGIHLLKLGDSAPSPATTIPGLAAGQAELPFSAREGLISRGEVFAVAKAVAGTDWWILREQPVSQAMAPLTGFVTASAVVAILVVAVILGLFTAFWWRLNSHHNQTLAGQYESMAKRIDAQKRFLDSISGSVVEFIGLKSRSGSYQYVNDAFAEAVGRSRKELRELDDYRLFGASAAERLKISDERALKAGAQIIVNEKLQFGRGERQFQISKVPYHGSGLDDDGILMVARDVTELTEAERRHAQAIHQMVRALVRAVELRDPYLAGHSRRVAGFAVAVAERMNFSQDDIDTLDIAASLSQIGKLKVSRAILSKPSRLDNNELNEMQQHLDYAMDVLKDIDFGLPVRETVMQMHERLDGKGYPKGLAGDEILMSARVLSACDVFCARIEPRCYRPVISTEAAIQILESHPDRYDISVVEKLREVLKSVEGERLTADIAAF